ncbi:hypothetical protein BRARA_A00247 [Brassica rapa]|uniref:Uncharacterized protein n=1 Tax=Brassica campestris TaxID=3711 RepID=A0A398APP7_BRACM|nr:hypothetical protein BRARA_A00247 [Brassica rapa]
MGQSQNPLFLFLLLVLVYGVSSTTFTVVNQCSYTVWPATLAEFTLNGAGGLDFYDVSLVDGYNIPMAIVPQGGGDASGVAGNCTITGCVKELNGPCPAQLKVATTGTADGVACKSACEAFGTPEYCCSGAFATPDTCKPSEYSLFFKNACPRAYSYAYDDGTSTFTCAGADYLITFCPSPNPSVKSAKKEGVLEPEAVSYSSASPTLSTVFSVGVLAVAFWALQRVW